MPALLNLSPRCGLRSLFLMFFLFMSATAFAQPDLNMIRFTVHVKDISLEKLRVLLNKQVPGRSVHIIPNIGFTDRLTLDVTNGSFADLNVKLAPYGLMLIAETRTIFIKNLSPDSSAHGARPSVMVRNRDSVSVWVLSDKGEPLPGTTVSVKRTGKGAHSRKDGSAVLYHIKDGDSLHISHIGFRSVVQSVEKNSSIKVVLSTEPDQLGETVIINYYSGKDRLQTGNVSQVSGLAINEQPVSNLPLALSGRMPGLLITQTSGVQGAGVHMQVRGPISIASGTDPFILIDRVPYSPNNTSITNIASNNAAGSLSPFVLLNIADVESVELLKDADATAIYGSRGANGVLLITTRKAHLNEPRWNLQVSSGAMGVTRITPTLNTQQYSLMRLEALKNDGLKADSSNVPELINWDTLHSTNFPKLLTGGVAHRSNLNASLSDAGKYLDYRLSTHYLHETNVFPGHLPDDQLSGQANVTFHSPGDQLDIELSGLYCKDWNHQYVNDLTSFQLLIPNTPALLDAGGNPVFESKGISFSNPYAAMLEPYEAVSENILGNAFIRYRFWNHFAIRANIGYNHIGLDETSRIPIAAQDPANVPTGSSYYAGTNFRSWIVEPQLERMDTLGRLALNFLAGGSIQRQESDINTLAATGYTSDAVLGQPSGAGSLTATDNLTEYRYAAVYGRAHFNYDNAYIVNLTARRDGSSRFGAGKQFGNFGAIGGAWIFTKLDLFRNKLPLLSFGKLRGSIGVTGNDQIGDYRYRTIWAPTTTAPYQGTPGFYPTNVANPNLAWEKVEKREVAMELGFLRDRIFTTAAYYDNRSSNQLILFSLPLQTGFSTEIKNSGAVVVEKGWELTLRAKLLDGQKVDWSISLNVSVPTNRLVAFPNLSNTPYAGSLIVGQSLNVYRGYRYLGVDKNSGIYQFASKGGMPVDSDRTAVGNFDTHWYGGFSSNLRIGRVVIDLFVEVRDQTGVNYQTLLSTLTPPGMWSGSGLTNQTTAVLNRWQKAGDHAVYQQFTSSGGTVAGQAYNYYPYSSAFLADASFVRIKTLSVSWSLPEHFLKGMAVAGGRVYLAAENLLTFTPYQGTDPETQRLVLPPLRTVEAGIQVNFK